MNKVSHTFDEDVLPLFWSPESALRARNAIPERSLKTLLRRLTLIAKSTDADETYVRILLCFAELMVYTILVQEKLPP